MFDDWISEYSASNKRNATKVEHAINSITSSYNNTEHLFKIIEKAICDGDDDLARYAIIKLCIRQRIGPASLSYMTYMFDKKVAEGKLSSHIKEAIIGCATIYYESIGVYQIM
jgi:hypothetical protein